MTFPDPAGPRKGLPTDATSTAAIAVEDRMFRALLVLRVVLLANVIGLTAYRSGTQNHTGIYVAVGCMIAWTAFVSWAYGAAHRRRATLLVPDLLIALACLLLTPVLKGEDFNATIPGFWVMAPMLAWAVHWRWIGGLIAASAVTIADISIRIEFSQANYGNLFLLMIGGPIVGYMCQNLQRMATERDAAERAAAVAQERARLARAVHDGVLQVLALVQRRGVELGGAAEDLGRLAGEQEVALRSLIRQQDAYHPAPVIPVRRPAGRAAGRQTGGRLAAGRHSARQAPEPETVDVAAVLDALEQRRPPAVSVAAPGVPVRLPVDVGNELVAVVKACLDNVARHVGEDAPAWVLVEDVAGEVTVTVRDEGPGIPEGRLDQAVEDGRLGVSESIVGRARSIGGEARLTTGDFGTEWEITVPRTREAAGPA